MKSPLLSELSQGRIESGSTFKFPLPYGREGLKWYEPARNVKRGACGNIQNDKSARAKDTLKRGLGVNTRGVRKRNGCTCVMVDGYGISHPGLCRR